MRGTAFLVVLTLAAQEPKGSAGGQRVSAEALSDRAAALARENRLSEAIPLYQQALRINPKLYPVHFNLGVAYLKQQDCAKAVPEFRAFLKAQPAEPRARQLLGLCLAETGAYKEAIGELEQALRGNPGDPSVRFSLAWAHARSGNIERGEELLREVNLPPQQARQVEASLEMRRGRFSEAKVLFEEMLKENPNSAPALAGLGRLALLENDDSRAIELLEKAVRLSPRDAESTYQLGVLYERNGKPDEGIAMLRRALILRENYADPHYQLGRIAFNQKQYTEALQELKAAARILPDHEAIRFLLGRTYQAMGRGEDARREFAEVRRIKAATIDKARDQVEAEIPLKP